MRRILRPSILAVTTVALVVTGGLIAYAGWSSGTDSDSFTIYAATIPRVPAPRASVPDAAAVPASVADGAVAPTAPSARPRIGWKPVRLAPDVPVHRYVVTRHLGPVTEVVCERPATAALRCVDRSAPAGYRMTYTVAARLGAHWVGANSVRSAVITTPGTAVPVTVNGVAVLPGVDGEPIVPGAVPSASAAVAPASPGGTPSVEPSEDDDGGPGGGTGITVAPNPQDPVVPSGSVGTEPSDSVTGEPEGSDEPTRPPGNGPPPGLPGPPPGLPAPPGLPGPPPGLPF